MTSLRLLPLWRLQSERAGPASQPPSGPAGKFLSALAADLKANAGKCVVIPGEQQTPAVHLAAIAINQALGNVGKTVVYTETVNPMPSIQGQDIVTLVNDMKAGKVEWLLILNANPVYTAPVDLHFEEALSQVKMTAHLGSHFNETAVVTEWHINGTHYLENWSDTRAYDGTATVIQPMIDPLYGGKSAHDVIQSMLDDPDTLSLRGGAQDVAGEPGHRRRGARLAQGTARRHGGGNGFSAQDGFRQGWRSRRSPRPTNPDGTVEVIFRADPNIYDGRYANVGWLQEIPKPVTSMSWDNAALMSYRTLAKFGLAEQDVVAIESNGNTVMAPVLAVPGHADGSVTLYLGYAPPQRRPGGRRPGLQRLRHPHFQRVCCLLPARP